jgi:hypothetical protein
MAAEILDHADGLVTLKISGRLAESELSAVQAATTTAIRNGGKWRVLVLTEKFLGWEPGGEWSDFSLQAEADAGIEKMAIVGERRWEGLALLFAAKGLRPFPIEFFEPTQLSEARAWLTAN